MPISQYSNKFNLKSEGVLTPSTIPGTPKELSMDNMIDDKVQQKILQMVSILDVPILPQIYSIIVILTQNCIKTNFKVNIGIETIPVGEFIYLYEKDKDDLLISNVDAIESIDPIDDKQTTTCSNNDDEIRMSLSDIPITQLTLMCDKKKRKGRPKTNQNNYIKCNNGTDFSYMHEWSHKVKENYIMSYGQKVIYSSVASIQTRRYAHLIEYYKNKLNNLLSRLHILVPQSMSSTNDLANSKNKKNQLRGFEPSLAIALFETLEDALDFKLNFCLCRDFLAGKIAEEKLFKITADLRLNTYKLHTDD